MWVVTPVYNGERFLHESIESVLQQTYDEWRYVIVDNRSTDRTAEIAADYAARDGRISLSQNREFLPIMANWNHALRLLPDGQEEPVYVLALGEGAFAALSPICTHLGCTVDIQGERLVCPCHGSTYDRVGKVLQGPAQQPLARYRTALSADGVLTVDLRARA